MRRVLADLVAYAKQYLRSPSATFFTLVFPIILLLVFGGVFGNPEQVNIEVHVQDLDDSLMSRTLIDAVGETGVITIVMISPDEDLEAYVREQSIPAALLIPEDFETEVQMALAGSPFAQPEVVLYGDLSNSAFQTVQGTISSVVTGFNFMLHDVDRIVEVGTQSISQESASALDFFLPGIIGITVLTPLFAVSTTAAEYSERNYFKLLATTPLRKSEFLFSRTVWMVILIFISTILMILIARLVFGTLYVLTPVAVALIAAGSVLFVSIGMAIGNFAKATDAASAVANVIYFPMMFLTGTFFPLEIMPDFIQTVSRFLPLTYFNDGLRDTLVFGNVSSALTNLGIVSVLAVAMFALAAWSLRWRAE
ncbi:MAG: ABC transporter permease [Thermoplasmata archaeon]